MRNLEQEINLQSVKVPELVTATETNADTYIDIRGQGKRLAMVIHANLTSSKTAACQLTCATDANGTSKDDVSGKTVTLTGDTSKIGGIWFVPTDLDLVNDHFFVGVDITTNQASDQIEAHLMSIPDFVHGAINPS